MNLSNTNRSEDFLCLLYGSDAFPLVPLEDLHAGRVVQRGGRMSTEERREPVPVGEGRGTGPVG